MSTHLKSWKGLGNRVLFHLVSGCGMKVCIYSAHGWTLNIVVWSEYFAKIPRHSTEQSWKLPSVSFFMNSIIRNVWNTRMNRDRDSIYATHFTWSCSIQCDNWKKCCKTFGSCVVSVCVWMRQHPSKLIHASTTNHIHLVLHSVFAMMKRSKSYFSDSSSVCWSVEK